MSHHVNVSYYAILIGINAYPDSPLRSCVQDVQKIRECLEKRLDAVSVTMLFADNISADNVETSAKGQEWWPTYQNVTSAFEKTAARAKSGDFVYIHYSGHGTRMKPCFDRSNKSTGDLALVLLEGDQSKERFLRGPRLAGLLKPMEDKGLIVTLVLDCCFSAAVYRNSSDSDIRYLPFDHSSDPHPPEAGSSSAPKGSGSGYRGACMRDNWLLNPDYCTILVACGPHEKGKGGSDMRERGKRYGALSYFLLKVLGSYELNRTHKDIHRHLCAKFREYGIPQHPVLLGNKNQGFFGCAKRGHALLSICVVEHDGEFELQAGKAHGFRDGDRFVVSASDTKQTYRVDTQPVSWSCLAKFHVRLDSSIRHHTEWLQALDRLLIGTCGDNDPSADFHVILRNGEYEILDERNQYLDNLPTMAQDKTDANHVCDILSHLARFKMAEQIVNDACSSDFQESFDVRVITKSGGSFGPGKQIEVKHNDMLEVIINNTGDTVLYVHLYCLGSFWEVKDLLCATYEAIPQRGNSFNEGPEFTGTSIRKIKMTVPPIMQRYRGCRDIIKVFVTNKPTSFDLLELPSLDQLKVNSKSRASATKVDGKPQWQAVHFPIWTSL